MEVEPDLQLQKIMGPRTIEGTESIRTIPEATHPQLTRPEKVHFCKHMNLHQNLEM